MKKEKILKFRKTCFMVVVVMMLVSPMMAFAESYAGHDLTCNSSITSKKGTASTGGTANPYYNAVNLVVYKNSDPVGSDVQRARGITAVATRTGSGLTKALSNHYVCDSSYTPIGSALETIVKYAYVN